MTRVTRSLALLSKVLSFDELVKAQNKLGLILQLIISCCVGSSQAADNNRVHMRRAQVTSARSGDKAPVSCAY
jgi:hypothetical protein